MKLHWLFTQDKSGKWTTNGRFTESECNQILKGLEHNLLHSFLSNAETEAGALKDLKEAIKRNQFP